MQATPTRISILAVYQNIGLLTFYLSSFPDTIDCSVPRRCGFLEFYGLLRLSADSLFSEKQVKNSEVRVTCIHPGLQYTIYM